MQIQDAIDFLLVNVGTVNIPYKNFMGYRLGVNRSACPYRFYVMSCTTISDGGLRFVCWGGILWYLDHD